MGQVCQSVWAAAITGALCAFMGYAAALFANWKPDPPGRSEALLREAQQETRAWLDTLPADVRRTAPGGLHWFASGGANEQARHGRGDCMATRTGSDTGMSAKDKELREAQIRNAWMNQVVSAAMGQEPASPSSTRLIEMMYEGWERDDAPAPRVRRLESGIRRMPASRWRQAAENAYTRACKRYG